MAVPHVPGRRNICQSIFCFCIVLLLLAVCTTGEEEEDDLPKIGIIGAGISGTSTAYFIRELFGNEVQIDVFEKKSVGGRIASVSIGGNSYEAGASIIHPRNMYMVNFTKMLGLQKIDDAEAGTLGIFDGKDMLFATSPWGVVTLAKLAWRYGLDIYNLGNWIQELLKKFDRIYDIQRGGHAFSTVEDLLAAMDKSFLQKTKQNTRTVLKEDGFSDRFIDEFVAGGLNVNNGQTPDVHALNGAICIAGAERGLWSVQGGNKLIPEKLLKLSKASLIEGEVTKIKLLKRSEIPSFEIQYTPVTADTKAQKKTLRTEYDIVIVATPLHKGVTDITFDNFPKEIQLSPTAFHQTVATFVEGHPNTSYFGYESSDSFPTSILVNKKDVFFNSFAKKIPVEIKEDSKKDSSKDSGGVYKVFSDKVPTEEQVKSLFSSRTDLRMVTWQAYPDYHAGMELPSFVLHEQLYYVNSIEMAASAMEMCVIGSKNVALLAHYHWNGQYDKIDEFLSENSEGKDEL